MKYILCLLLAFGLQTAYAQAGIKTDLLEIRKRMETHVPARYQMQVEALQDGKPAGKREVTLYMNKDSRLYVFGEVVSGMNEEVFFYLDHAEKNMQISPISAAEMQRLQDPAMLDLLLKSEHRNLRKKRYKGLNVLDLDIPRGEIMHMTLSYSDQYQVREILLVMGEFDPYSAERHPTGVKIRMKLSAPQILPAKESLYPSAYIRKVRDGYIPVERYKHYISQQ